MRCETAVGGRVELHPSTVGRMPLRTLSRPVPDHFERFYRDTLRFVSGGRLRALDIATLYASWAKRADAPAMNNRQLKRAMQSVGHQHFRSNVTFYGDVALAADAPDLADNFPDSPVWADPKAVLLGQIEQLAAAVHQLSVGVDQVRRSITRNQLN